MQQLRFRILADIVLLAGVVFLPWYLLLGLMIAAGFFFPKYYEVLIFGVVRDILYGYAGAWPVFSIVAFAVWIAASILRTRVAFH